MGDNTQGPQKTETKNESDAEREARLARAAQSFPKNYDVTKLKGISKTVVALQAGYSTPEEDKAVVKTVEEYAKKLLGLDTDDAKAAIMLVVFQSGISHSTSRESQFSAEQKLAFEFNGKTYWFSKKDFWEDVYKLAPGDRNVERKFLRKRADEITDLVEKGLLSGSTYRAEKLGVLGGQDFSACDFLMAGSKKLTDNAKVAAYHANRAALENRGEGSRTVFNVRQLANKR